MADHDALITQFCSLTGVAAHEASTYLITTLAEQYLVTNQWDLSSAAAEYYTSLEEGAAEEETPGPSRPSHPQRGQSSGPDNEAPYERTLDGRPVPALESSRSSSNRPAQKKKFATLNDVSSSSAHAGHSHDDDDDDDPDYDPQDLFAGGEKSGLAVQNPDDLKRKIIERAKKAVPRPGGDAPTQPPSHFTGTAHTLGGDEVPSRMIPDSTSSRTAPPPRVERTLHFWADGFSVDDGPLHRLDDPRNAEILTNIRQGRAPLGLLNVRPDQEVDVRLMEHEEKYVAPKKKYMPFSGQGQRLGSPTPGIVSHAPATATSSSSTSMTSPSVSTPNQPSAGANTPTLNPDTPTVSLQVRLPDGTRLPARFNTTHTIGDVYDFVGSASPITRSRPWVLMTTFPSKELNDKAQKLENVKELSGGRGGVVIVKWS
ncbi:MAG: hypothetical protein M1834_005000 [Cirrosporium novae-zelandiae]|nr:MAG: hypothetical protein M1834_005000 [Cirrosporium novae-zelandiae]